jgi:tetratricopeptide (TPR) repeat protein
MLQELDKKSGDTEGVVRALNNLGTVYFRRKHFDEALRYYKKAIRISEKHLLMHHLNNALYNAAEVYVLLNNYKKAAPFVTKSLELSQRLKDTTALADLEKLMRQLNG